MNSNPKTLIVADELNPNALDAFDYIMNTKATYDALGAVVVKLESRAKSQRQSPATELLRAHNSQCRCSREWFKMAIKVLHEARQDYRRNFAGEEPPDWLTYQTLTVCEVVAVALAYRDRLPTSTL